MPRKSIQERFWSKVDKRGPDECWPWLGYKYKGRAQLMRVRGRPTWAARVAFETTGASLGDKFALHTCHNPACVNPAHIYAGTQMDNIHDCIDAGRFSPPPIMRGEDNHITHLTAPDIRIIRASVQSSRKLGSEFGVSKTTILRIKSGVVWGHVA